jgi:hypothetical protein
LLRPEEFFLHYEKKDRLDASRLWFKAKKGVLSRSDVIQCFAPAAIVFIIGWRILRNDGGSVAHWTANNNDQYQIQSIASFSLVRKKVLLNAPSGEYQLILQK